MSHEMKYEDPIDQYYCQRNDDAKHFAFVDFLLVTPGVTAEQIFAHTGIRLSDFDIDEDGEGCPTTPDEFRDEVIGEAFQDNWDLQETQFIDQVRAGDPLYPVGEKWTAVELFQLFRALKHVFEPADPTWLAVLTGIQVSLPEVLPEPQPA